MDNGLKALADPTRLRILALVAAAPLSAGSIAAEFDVSRPAISQHIAVLRAAGLIGETRDGTRRLYSARLDALGSARFAIDQLWSERLAALAEAAQADHGGAAGSGAASAPGRPQQSEAITVERAAVMPALPTAVWSLLTDQRRTVEWMGVAAHIDARVGGDYRVEVVPDQWAVGTVLECDKPRLFAHTWGWEGAGGGVVPPGTSVVVYHLLAAGPSTVIHLTHTHLPGMASAGSHSRGWEHYLARLAAVAAGQPPERDPWVDDPEVLLRELRPPLATTIGEPA